MKRQMFAFLLAIASCFTMGATTALASEMEDAMFENDVVALEPKNEYQMAIEKTQQLEDLLVCSENESYARERTPLEEFKDAFDARAELDAETLKGMGYSDAEIALLRDYKNGECSFEVAAARASAELSSNLTCSTHTAQKYSVMYSWEWDKTPVGLGQDGVAMGLCGIDSQSKIFVTKLNSSSVSVTYYYTDNTRYRTEYPSMNVKNDTVDATFDSYKLNDLGDRWVWAKKGSVMMTISPAVNGGTAFAAVRAAGEYGHSSKNSTQITIEVSVNIFTGDITTAFTVAPSSTGSVTAYGRKQILFYNDGSKFTEGK